MLAPVGIAPGEIAAYVTSNTHFEGGNYGLFSPVVCGAAAADAATNAAADAAADAAANAAESFGKRPVGPELAPEGAKMGGVQKTPPP